MTPYGAAPPEARCWCCGMRRCECCGPHHDCRYLHGDRCCDCRAQDLLEEAAAAALDHPGDEAMPQTRIAHTPEQLAQIPDRWRAHAPSFVLDSAGPGCTCCGPGSLWCECACGARSPAYDCAAEARRWHETHARRHVAA